MLSDEMLIERFRMVDPAPNEVETATSATELLTLIDERSGLMQTQKPERNTHEGTGRTIGRGLLVAAAAFVVIILAGAIFFLVQPEGEVANNPTTTTQATNTTVEAQDLGDPRLDAAIGGAIDVAAERRYEATIEPWEPQLVYVTGGPQCQTDADTVQFTDLDTLTAEQAMVRFTNGDTVGTVEVLRFADPAVAQEAAPILERLLRSQRECITDALTTALGTVWTNAANETIPVDNALGAFLFTYEYDDGTDRTAYVQVAAGIEDDLMYVVTFSSSTAPIDNGFLADLYFISTDAAK